MKRILVIALIAFFGIVPINQVSSQTPQEMQTDTYCPKHIVAQCSTYSKLDTVKFEYTSTTATAATITLATNVLTITIGGVATTYDTTGGTLDTYAEVVAVVEAAHAGLAVTLGDQVYGTETCDFTDHTAVSILNVIHGLNVDARLTFGAKLYYAGKRPCVYRIITNTTFTGTTNLYIYTGDDAHSNTSDTLIWSQTLAATTVDTDIDLHPYMIAGSTGGYLKVFIVEGTTLTAGTLTILGAYK